MQPRRIRKFDVFCNMAKELATLSECSRLQNSAIIYTADFSAILAIGYNGPPAGSFLPCTGEEGNCGCIHAEANALVKLQQTSRMGLQMICTTSPCTHCAGLIINSKCLHGVYYFREYRTTTGLDRLNGAGIETRLI